jgi:site-specific DNA-cytosine methylase
MLRELAINMSQMGKSLFNKILILDGTRVDDVRVYEDEIMQTVISRWGTGGGNVPVIAYSIREDAKANTFSATELQVTNALQAHQPSVQSHHAQTFIVQEDDMEHDPLVMRDREGKAGGGKGPLISDTAFTLSTSNFHTVFPSPTIVRRLTPVECERLQGFPDGWTEGQADSQRYKQMGNAVAVPVVSWIVDRLLEAAR